VSESFSLEAAGVDITQELLVASLGAGMRGDLYKLGGKRKSKWQRRYFVLDDVGMNWYRNAQAKLYGNVYASAIKDVSAAPDPTGEGRFVFTLAVTTRLNKEYYLAADEEPERDRWVAKIRDMIREG
jgi:hypothetical protein